jgi:hypothetical protein
MGPKKESYVAKVIEKLGAELDIQPKFPDFQHTMYV